MRVFFFVALSLSLLSGCAEITDFYEDDSLVRGPVEYDAELLPYYEEYAEYSGDERLDTERVVFADQPEGTNGVCRWSGEFEAIEIDPGVWEVLDEFRRRALMLHEFGHCEGRRSHVDERMNVMYPWLLSEEFFSENWFDVVVESFGYYGA